MTVNASVPAAYVLALAKLVHRWHIGTEALLADLPLTAADLREPTTRVDAAVFRVLVQRACRLSGEPGLAVHFGRALHLATHGYLGFAALAAPSLRAVFDLAVRFLPTRGVDVGLEVHVHGPHTAICLVERAPLGDLREFVVVTALQALATLIGELLGAPPPMELTLALPRPAYVERLRHLMPSTVRFGGEVHQLVLASALLDEPLRHAEPSAVRLASEMLERELDQLDRVCAREQRVRELVLMPEGFRSLEDIARAMHTSSRTVRRLLAARGLTYTQLLEDARRERALVLLRLDALSISRVAEVLGYADVTGFSRAFRRWIGTSPGSYRRGTGRGHRAVHALAAAPPP